MLRRRDVLTTAAAAAASTALPKTIYAQTGTKKLSLLTWNIIDMEPLFKQWFATFQSQNPGVEIEWLDKKGPELPAFYQTQLAAGTPPDIVDVQGGLGLEWAGQGALLDITPLLDKEPAVRARFNPEYLSNWVFEGKNYMLPFYVAKTLLFYNKPMFKAAGIDYAPKGLDDLLGYAKAMSGSDRTGFLTLNFDWLYWPLLRMQGVDLLTPDLKKPTFNTAAGIETADKLAKATADGSINKISWTGRWVEPNGAFAAGNVGMLHAHASSYFFVKTQGSWIKPDTIGIAEVPGFWSTPNVHGYGISKGAKNPELAWSFLKFVTDKQQALQFARGRTLTTANIEVDKEFLAEIEKSNPTDASVLRTQIAHTDKMTGNWRLGNDSAVKNIVWAEMQNIFLGRRGAKEALADAEKKVERELRRGA
ncbi:MAG: ABC transporter substrate-binding protein [Hyphomicrobiales bacterium]